MCSNTNSLTLLDLCKARGHGRPARGDRNHGRDPSVVCVKFCKKDFEVMVVGGGWVGPLIIGETRQVARAGTHVHLPAGTPHAFKNEGDQPARMLVMVAPAGLEKMFFEFGTVLPDGSATAPPPSQDEIAKLVAIAPNYGIELLRREQ